MKLEYKILWIDDRINQFSKDGDIKEIEEFISNLGFEPYINAVENADDESIYTSTKYDLILTDYNLNDNQPDGSADHLTGDKLIEMIRNHQIFTEVLFYSANDEFDEIAKKIYKDRISFHHGMGGLLTKIKLLIALTVDKLQELNAMRGLITAETSSIDVLIEQIVFHILKQLPEEKAEIHKEDIAKHYITDCLATKTTDAEKLLKSKGFEHFFIRMEAARKLRAFRNLIYTTEYLKDKLDDIKVNVELLKTYQTEIIEIRNKFAHAKEIEKDGLKYLAGFGKEGDEFEFNQEQCTTIRKNIKKHRNNLLSISNILGVEL